MDSDKGREVKAHYLAVGRRMRAYSASLHKQWFETVDAQLIALLRRTLLVVPFTVQQHGSGAVPAADVSGQALYSNNDYDNDDNNIMWFETVDAQLIALLRRTLLVVPFTIQQHGSGAVPAADVSGQTLYNNDTTTTTTNNDDWWRSIVVKTAGSAGVLSLSCT